MFVVLPQAGNQRPAHFDPCEHVDIYLEMLEGFLDECDIARRVQGSGSAVSLVIPEERRLAATVDPVVKAANLDLVSKAFERFDWARCIQAGCFLGGTEFACIADSIAGIAKFSACSVPETFMSPTALGLDTETESWWVGFQGSWCPGVCFVVGSSTSVVRFVV